MENLSGKLTDMAAHWRENGIFFDAILVGYLGSIPAVEAAGEILETMLAPGGVAVVDPAMGDNGRLYAGFDVAYVEAVKGLCSRADILLPNLTEEALLGRDVFENKTVILTGYSDDPDKTGFLLRTGEGQRAYAHRRIGGGFHGTGDIFAAVFTGALMQGREAYEAAKIAADFVGLCIENTIQDPSHWYGVKFEPLLLKLAEMVKTVSS